MFLLFILSCTLAPLVHFASLTRAVSVVLRFQPHVVNILGENVPSIPQTINQAQICNNLRPGRCCQGREWPVPHELGPGVDDYRVAHISGLQILDVAAVWTPQNGVGGCSGVPVTTTIGPGSFRYPADGGLSDVMLSGVSYIRLPHAPPSGPNSKIPIYEAQGILGLITGGGSWVSSSANPSLAEKAANIRAILGGASARHKRRGIRSQSKGVVLAQPPPDIQWPDLIIVNGTNFTEISPGNSVYTSEQGSTLDFSGK